jgi:RNA polymerase sigma-70 factor, ECF subfamily
VDIDRFDAVADMKHIALGAGEPSSVVARAAAGDHDAFTSLVAMYHADMTRLAAAIGRNPDLARDAVQNAWQLAWLRLSGLRDEAKIRPWLLSIAANETRLLLRRRRVTEDITDQFILELGDPAHHVDDLDLNAALGRLDPHERELLGLRYVLGYTSVELAEHFSLTPEGVRSRLKRLIDRLRQELSHD